ncbi:MAG: methyltransferase domain-containing protein, partial [Candidatus Portiera sp.]|nr:methyltransferase domain-containing protein [Portiera sp.]
ALGGIDYLHYGYWDIKTKPTIGGLFKAQDKHTKELLNLLDKRAAAIKKNRSKKNKSKTVKTKTLRILDIGCGSGKILSELLEKGYQADGMVPSDCLYEASCDNVNEIKLSKNKTHAENAKNCKVYKCYLEDFYTNTPKVKYDILLFSESFQYIKYKLLYENIDKLLDDNGEIIISDFFAKEKSQGAANFGGGHLLNKFYADTKNSGIKIISDKDITKYMAPNLDLLHDILMDKLLPSSRLLDEFLKTRGRFIYSVLKFLGRKSLKKINYKYFSGQRTAKEFSKSKSYRMLVLSNKLHNSK